MSYPLASEVSRLIVGETYMVPCVAGVPVIGEPHEDNDHFNTTERHLHCDSRFHVRPGDEVTAECGMWPRQTSLQPKVCVRTTPAPFKDNNFGMARMSLHADYGFSELKCGLCPHKGMPIINGVCSGHRLEWLPDGTIRHKPPYTIRIRGTANQIVITERQHDPQFVIPIVEAFQGVNVLEMIDSDGRLVSQHDFGWMSLAVDDEFRCVYTPKQYNYEPTATVDVTAV